MTRNYLLSYSAEQDIAEIVTDIAQKNPRAAMKFLDKLYITMDNISDNPCMGFERKDWTAQAVRFFPIRWHYLIVYQYTSPIKIVRVLSGYRDLVRIL